MPTPWDLASLIASLKTELFDASNAWMPSCAGWEWCAGGIRGWDTGDGVWGMGIKHWRRDGMGWDGMRDGIER